ncbi:MAG TPA: triphosphoribosyl-dephospho-CoA synthase [Gemmataceae bacterium]|nr:triphosphoribosyl-dephospho-CoA synthase [Gemmataceae bacterium]
MSDIGLYAQLACIWEATARKPGNVHRYHDFDDAGYLDFLVSAAAIAPVLEAAPGRRVGETVLDAVRATRRVAATNTNLGIILLLAPLAAVPPGEELRAGLARVLDGLDVADARAVYQAIRLAAPGGLGRVPEQDVAEEPTQSLRQVMALAAGHDLVARQYADGFCEVFDDGVPTLQHGLDQTGSLEAAIIGCHLHLMATYPDTLIARKRGPAEAAEAAERARRVLDEGWPHRRAAWDALAELDAWLRAEGHGRNPGTTADLVTACLFVALRTATITLPCPFPWSAGAGHD